MSGSREMFEMVDGKKADAHLHEPILEDGDHAAATDVSIVIARHTGLTPSEIASLYPGRS
jgi:hypothetical protein